MVTPSMPAPTPSVDTLLAFYREVAEGYDAFRYPSKLAEFRSLEQDTAIELAKDGFSVLDVGFGSGEHLEYLLNSRNRLRLVGVDYCREMLNVAAKKVTSKATLIGADIRTVTFPDDHFDVGICFCTLPNIAGHEDVFHSLGKACKTLAVSVYHLSASAEISRFYAMNGFNTELHGRLLVSESGFFYNFLSPDFVQGMFAKAGYRLVTEQHEIGTIYIGTR